MVKASFSRLISLIFLLAPVLLSTPASLSVSDAASTTTTPRKSLPWIQRRGKQETNAPKKSDPEKQSSNSTWGRIFQRPSKVRQSNEKTSAKKQKQEPKKFDSEEEIKEILNAQDSKSKDSSSNNSVQEEKTEKAAEEKNDQSPDKPKPPRRFVLGRHKAKPEKVSNATVTKENESTSSTTTEPSSDDNKKEMSPPSTVNATKPEETSNKTATVILSAPPQLQQHPYMGMYPPSSQHPPGVIVMGLDGRPQQGIARRSPNPTSTTFIVAEAMATVVGTTIRFWFLTSLARWFADEEIKSLKKPTQHFVWERLNDKYVKDHEALASALKAPPNDVPDRRWRRHVRRMLRQQRRMNHGHHMRHKEGLETMFNRTVVVIELGKSPEKGGELDFHHFDEVVSFVVAEHRRKAFGTTEQDELEVVILLESPGGPVSDFGLGASQVRRLSQEEGIMTTICVDKVAASGGYMLASQADKLLAAPFAVVGSIGVIREGLNFNKALERFGVDPIVLTAGDAKAPLTSYGEITRKGLAIAQRNLEKTHSAFRDLVVLGRPILEESIKKIADGDIFLGSEAQELNLIDGLMTSEEYIMERIQSGDRVLKLHRIPHFIRNRRLPSIHPLDFLKDSGIQQWLSEQDIPRLVSRVLQTTSFLRFVKFLMRNR